MLENRSKSHTIAHGSDNKAVYSEAWNEWRNLIFQLLGFRRKYFLLNGVDHRKQHGWYGVITAQCDWKVRGRCVV